MVMKAVVIAIIGWACHLVAGQENACLVNICDNLVGTLQSNPGKSCDDIYQINKASRGASGNYWIKANAGVHRVYCDMELECGGHKGGWMRIADLDTSRGDDCPSGWTKITTNNVSGHPSIAVCRSPSDNPGCYPTTFTVNEASYQKICGKARGYQRHTIDAFGGPRDASNNKNINDYVDGLSITLGKPRKHVWTYAAGFGESGGVKYTHYCPCAATPGTIAYPFIGNHYYCESGFVGPEWSTAIFYTSDPLWDGSGCFNSTTSCCANADMPWFYRQFAMAQKDDIEVRICADQGFGDEAVAVDQIQLFVQ